MASSARQIQKAKAGVEDLLLGDSPATVIQTRNGASYSITKINADQIPYSGNLGDVGTVSVKDQIDSNTADTLSKYNEWKQYIVTELEADIAAIGTTEITFVILDNQTLTDDLTIPSSVILEVKKSGLIIIPTGKTITINSPANIQASISQQIFDGDGTVVFTNPDGQVFVDWWETNTTPGTTDMGPAINAALASLPSGKVVKLLQTTYYTSVKITDNDPELELSSLRSFATYSQATFVCTIKADTLADRMMEFSSFGGIVLKGFELQGSDSTTITGGLYLKDNGASTNRGNYVNIRVDGIATEDAIGIDVESWGTTLDHCRVSYIPKGIGVNFGASGVTLTTEQINRLYVIGCDCGVKVSTTTLGITFIDPIFESCPVAYYQRGNTATMINPYFEDVNKLNAGGANYSSASVVKIQNDPGTEVDYAIYLDGGNSFLNIIGGRLASLSSETNSKLLGVGTISSVKIDGFNFNSKHLNSTKVARVGASSVISISNPTRLYLEDLKDAVSSIVTSEDYDGALAEANLRIRKGTVESWGDSVYNIISRTYGDIHHYTDPYTIRMGAAQVGYSATDATDSALALGETDFDVVDGSLYQDGDYISLVLDDLTYHYTTIASGGGTNTITMTDAVPSAATSGNVISFWRWNLRYQAVSTSQVERSTTSGAAAAVIIDSIPIQVGATASGVLVKVVAQIGNSIRSIYDVYVENFAGTVLGVIPIKIYEASGIGTYDLTITGAYVSLKFSLSVQQTSGSTLVIESEVVGTF